MQRLVDGALQLWVLARDWIEDSDSHQLQVKSIPESHVYWALESLSLHDCNKDTAFLLIIYV